MCAQHASELQIQGHCHLAHPQPAAQMSLTAEATVTHPRRSARMGRGRKLAGVTTRVGSQAPPLLDAAWVRLQDCATDGSSNLNWYSSTGVTDFHCNAVYRTVLFVATFLKCLYTSKMSFTVFHVRDSIDEIPDAFTPTAVWKHLKDASDSCRTGRASCSSSEIWCSADVEGKRVASG